MRAKNSRSPKPATLSSSQHPAEVIDLRDYREQKARAALRTISTDQIEIARAQREAEGVMRFFRGFAPDFITEAVIDTIIEACELTGVEAPTYENDHEDESDTVAALTALFTKTKLLSLRRA